MRSKGFLWLVAILIGSALAFPPMISAAEKKAAQPCAAGEMKEKKEEKKEKKEKKEEKKEEKKAKKAAKKKAEKMEEKKDKKAAQPCAPAK